jgi:hypothetical protein
METQWMKILINSWGFQMLLKKNWKLSDKMRWCSDNATIFNSIRHFGGGPV